MTVSKRVSDLFPLTPAGFIILFVSVSTFFTIGVQRLDLVVLTLSAFIIGIVLLLSLLVSSIAIWLRLTWPQRLNSTSLDQPCGIPAATEFEPFLPRWLPLIEIDWKWLSPVAVTVDPRSFVAGNGEFVIANRRGRAETIMRKVTIRDVFGLTAISLSFTNAAKIRFTPAPAGLDSLRLYQSLARGEDLSDPRGSKEGDRVDMRRYAQGDPVRLILWKVYARTRKLLVRIPERAMASNPRACAYFVAGRNDEASAALARVMIERELLGESWRFGADGATDAAHTPEEAIESLVVSGNFDPSMPSGLGTFLKQAEKEGFAVCLVFMPPQPGKPAKDAATTISRSRLKTHIYAATDTCGAAPEPQSRLHHLLFQPPSKHISTRQDLLSMAQAFQLSPVSIVDRSTGQVLGDPRHWPDSQ